MLFFLQRSELGPLIIRRRLDKEARSTTQTPRRSYPRPAISRARLRRADAFLRRFRFLTCPPTWSFEWRFTTTMILLAF